MFRKNWIPLLLLGCAALYVPSTLLAQDAQATTESQPGLFEVLRRFNIFDTVGPEFRRLVEAGELDAARKLFLKQYQTYFRKEYVEIKRPVPKELKTLGEWHFASFRDRIDDSLARLRAITSVGTPATWSASSDTLAKARVVTTSFFGEELTNVSGVGVESLAELRKQIERVTQLFQTARPSAFSASFEQVIESGAVPKEYPDAPFLSQDFIDSSAFQERIRSAANAASTDAERSALLDRLQNLLSKESRVQLIERVASKKAKERILADGRVDLAELAEIRNLAKQSGASDLFEGLVKVGYVDLTATSFRDRNVFDFEVSFSHDYGINFEDAKEALLSKDRIVGYDFVFVTDLSAAKIFREFKDKRDQTSKTATGTRQDPNPAYTTAAAEYQQALAQMQKAKLDSSIQGARPCYGSGFACGLAALLRGASEGISESAVTDKAKQLANTPLTLSSPVYTEYKYQLVDISASKVARVDYYVIDVKKRQVLASYFEIKDHEKFLVSYNVEQNDPDRSSILASSQKEEDVTAWEKRPINIKLSDLFDPKNLASADVKPFTTFEAFIKPLSTRKYAPALPEYGKGVEPKTIVKGGDPKGAAKSTDSKGTALDSGTIADERFDSVVIIKNAKALGTGFYVTPDLILTAYHVVDKASLVEVTFYDGTKTFGKVIDHDVRLDLALVKPQVAGKPVRIHTGAIKLGETVEAIGHPKGFEFTITRGVVSALRKQSSAVIKTNALVEFVQTDTPISPGNSGGPLFLRDAVIGVNDWARVDKASQNLNFSVSFNEIRGYLNRFEGANK